jgi:hypothetical protein
MNSRHSVFDLGRAAGRCTTTDSGSICPFEQRGFHLLHLLNAKTREANATANAVAMSNSQYDNVYESYTFWEVCQLFAVDKLLLL